MKYQSQETRPSLWQIVLAVCLIAAMIVFYASGANAQTNATLSSYDLTYHPGRAEIDSSDWCPVCKKATDRVVGVSTSTLANTITIKKANGDIETIDPNVYTTYYTCRVCGSRYSISKGGYYDRLKPKKKP